MKALMLSTSLSSGKETLPTVEWMMLVLSTRNSTLPALRLLDGLLDVEGHRAGLGVGHQALGPQDAAQLADAAHDVGRGDDDVEVDPAAGDLLDELVAAGVVGPGRLGLLDLLARGQDADLLGLARAVGQDDRAADHLVGLLGVDPEPHGDVHGLVELGEVRSS